MKSTYLLLKQGINSLLSKLTFKQKQALNHIKIHLKKIISSIDALQKINIFSTNKSWNDLNTS